MTIHRPITFALLASLAFAHAAHAESARPAHDWSLSGHVGTAVGTTTEPSFAWRVGAHQWPAPGLSRGIEFGRLRWERLGGMAVPTAFEPFQGLAKGGDELLFVSLTHRFHGEGIGAHALAPLMAVGFGMFRHLVREQPLYAFPQSSPGETHVRYSPGWSLTFGGAATRGIAPGAEVRFDFIATEPDPSFYFSVNAGVLAGL